MRNIKYQKDYNLGDIISVYVKFGEFEILSKYMVMGVDISITNEKCYEEPILKQMQPG